MTIKFCSMFRSIYQLEDASVYTSVMYCSRAFLRSFVHNYPLTRLSIMHQEELRGGVHSLQRPIIVPDNIAIIEGYERKLLTYKRQRCGDSSARKARPKCVSVYIDIKRTIVYRACARRKRCDGQLTRKLPQVYLADFAHPVIYYSPSKNMRHVCFFNVPIHWFKR